jgi:hypothetical protein
VTPAVRTAGTTPHRSPATTLTANVNRIVVGESPALLNRGTGTGTCATISGNSNAATPTAKAPAKSATTVVSASCRRTKFQRGAPIARRIATSPRRASARARKRFATFAQAISNRRPVAPRRIQSGPASEPSNCSSSGTTRGVNRSMISAYLGDPPYFSGSRLAIVSSCAISASRSTPGFTRATRGSPKLPGWICARPALAAAKIGFGIQSVMSSRGKSKSGGMTPMTVRAWPAIE